jgi:ketosteroid isomerase-like protein
MKAMMVLAFTAALIGVPASAQSPAAADQEILKLERAYDDAFLKKDRAAMERLLADDFVYVHSNGTMTNRTQEIEETISADVKWTASKLDDLKVRVYGDVAVVTGVQTLTGSAKGYVSGARRFTNVWVRRNGRWQTVGGQSTLAPKK